MPIRWTWTLVLAACAALLVPAIPTAGPAVASLECGQVEAFADDLTDVGYTYDYQPSTSPTELASWVDVTVLGTLTGHAEIGSQRGAAGDVFVGYELAVDEVVDGQLPRGRDRATVAMGYAPSREGLDATAAAVPSGVPVVVFAHRVPAAPGGLVAAAVEGFVLGCGDGQLRGWVGDQGGWTRLRSVQEVADAARGGG